MIQLAHHGKFPSSGMTRLIALLGYPIGHTASPLFQNKAIEALGLDAVYLAFSVPPEEFEAAFHGLGALGSIGANFTVPHKEVAYALCTACSPEARVIKAVNTVKFEDGRAHGYNTDAHGIAAALAEEGYGFQHSKTVILGAGGAARAIAAQAILDGASELCVVNRTVTRAENLLTEIIENCRKLPKEERPRLLPRCQALGYDEIRDALRDADILINATSVGLKRDDPRLFDPMFINSSTLVYDIIYNPPQTRLLIDAKQSGCRKTANGLTMLLHQGAKAFELWFDRPAPVELMRNELIHPSTFGPPE